MGEGINGIDNGFVLSSIFAFFLKKTKKTKKTLDYKEKTYLFTAMVRSSECRWANLGKMPVSTLEDPQVPQWPSNQRKNWTCVNSN